MWVWLGLDAFPGSPAPGASSPQASQLQSPPSLTGFPTFLGPVGGICTTLLSVTRSFPTWLHAWPLGTLPPTLLEGCLGQGCVKALPGKSPDGARTSLHLPDHRAASSRAPPCSPNAVGPARPIRLTPTGNTYFEPSNRRPSGARGRGLGAARLEHVDRGGLEVLDGLPGG